MSNPAFERDPASFRDARGYVFTGGGRVLRVVTGAGIADAERVRATGLIEQLVECGWLIGERRVPTETIDIPGARLVLEHPRLPFVSYAYEWSFLGLQAAAMLHLDVQLAAHDRGVTLTDATAFNVQFIGARPVFIDHLSFRPYVDGELWAAHRQFCEQFLHPLLLSSLFGVTYQHWYRGRLEGIPGDELLPMLRWRHALSWKVLTHVVLPARLQRVAARKGAGTALRRRGLPRTAFRAMLEQLRDWIANLRPRRADGTTWADYDEQLDDVHTATKTAFVDEFVRRVRPRLLWDLGCNTGRYAEVALGTGADYVVGFDFDAGALHRAFERARDKQLRFLPLFQDLGNPTPGQGWRERERPGISGRTPPDALLALAVAHHLALSRNVPLDQLVDALTAMAPEGVIEFVPRDDPRSEELLRLREHLFRDYTEDNFLSLLSGRARIVRRQTLPESHRVLIWFSCR